VRVEDDATRWRDEYDFPARRRGEVIVEELPVGLPKGMSGFAFNTRRAMFSDARVRKALASMFDFEWINATLFGGFYVRTRSYFDDSALSSSGRPADAVERALLARFRARFARIFLKGAGDRRSATARGAIATTLVARSPNSPTPATRCRPDFAGSFGAALAFEILVKTRTEERLALNYSRMLARIGVAARVRLVDETQFQRRRGRFDFDMIPASFPASASRAQSSAAAWGSAAADMDGAYNVAGARSPAIDAMISAILAAREKPEFVDAVRALDRVLLSGFYIVPFYHANSQWIAYASRLGRPDKTPLFGPDYDAWWVKPAAK